MSRTIVSPSKKFTGQVVLPDAITFPQLILWRTCQRDALNLDDGLLVSQTLLPGICAIVEKWEILGFPEKVTPDNLPGSPTSSVILVLSAIIEAINEMVLEDAETPK